MIKKDNKGFTLIELLATIVILSLILVVAIPSVNAVVGIVKNGQKSNIIKNIEANASRYAFDTGENIFFVEDLVMYGYMDVDNDVINPVDNSSMNCYGIRAEKKGNYYIATFLDKEYKLNNKCNRNELLNDNSDITITSNKELIKNGEWIKTTENSVTLTADANCGGDFICNWYTSNGEKKSGKNVNIELITSQKIINLRYTFQLIDRNTASAKNAYFNILIDNEPPVINTSSTYYDTNNKELVIIANDGIGSGVKEYCISKDISCSNYSSSNRISTEDSSGLYIFVKDNVGNIAYTRI